MKLNIKAILGAAVSVIIIGLASCTDPLKFGNDFLEKAPGGTFGSTDSPAVFSSV